MSTAGEVERLRRIETIVRTARTAGNTAVIAEAASLLARLIRPDGKDDAGPGRVRRKNLDPMSRARERESDPLNAERQADGLRKLRAGRDPCTARRRDGAPCQAPAIAGGLVCRRHGGGSPQAQLKAEHNLNRLAVYAATCEWRDARGTPGELDALCKALEARRALEAYETKLRIIRELRAEVRRHRMDDAKGGSAASAAE